MQEEQPLDYIYILFEDNWDSHGIVRVFRGLSAAMKYRDKLEKENDFSVRNSPYYIERVGIY